ncbi:unnamed protein product [Meganyctiphanes norvegica]|uniref:Uncharacterized protein n=1 Tax=Meganyctiphanes norvegica TaxID=48144 RepID=A0AAV2RNW0_MEGNR
MVSNRCLIPVFLLLVIVLVTQQANAEAHYSPNNPEDVNKVEDARNEMIVEEKEDDEDGELDLDEEVFDTKVKQFAGINIINEEMEPVIVDPSEHVLRALSSPEEKNNALTLEKVKAMYREQQQEKEAAPAVARNTRDITSLDFAEIMAREENHAKEQQEEPQMVEEEGLYDKVLHLFW